MLSSTRKRAALTATLLGLVGALVGHSANAPGVPGFEAVWAAERAADRRLLAALASTSGEVFELWERTFPDAMRRRAAGRTDMGPDGNGPPSKAYYVLRRAADGSRRCLLGSVYLRDWIAGILPVAAGPRFSAMFAIDPRADSLSVVVTKSLSGSCDIEYLTVSATSAGPALQGDDPFPAEDPAGTWPPGPVLHEGRAPETRCVRLPSELGPVVGATLVSDEVGLLLHARTVLAGKTPVYLRRRLDGDRWEQATISAR